MSAVEQPATRTWTDGTQIDEHGPLGHSRWAKDERERRRVRVAELLRLRRNTTQIHARLNAEGFVCSRTAVGDDIKLLERRSQANALAAYNAMVRDETSKLDDLEGALWPKVIPRKRQRTDGDPADTEDDEDDPDIDATILNGLLRLFERRAKLHGLDKPTRIETSVEVTEVQAQLRQRFLVVLGLANDPDAFDALPLPSEMTPPVRDDSALRAAISQYDDDEPDDDEAYDDAEEIDGDEV